MRQLVLFLLMLLSSLNAFAGVMNYLPLQGDWKIRGGTATFTVNHILHSASGESSSFEVGHSHCTQDRCTFTIKSQVTSFKTADKKREEEMLQALEASKNPYLILTGDIHKKDSSLLSANFEIELAGKKQALKEVEITFDRSWDSLKTRGRFDTKLSSFLTKLPTLLGIPIDDKLSVQFDITWEKAP